MKLKYSTICLSILAVYFLLTLLLTASCSDNENGDESPTCFFVPQVDTLTMAFGDTLTIRAYYGSGVSQLYNTVVSWESSDVGVVSVFAKNRVVSNDSCFSLANAYAKKEEGTAKISVTFSKESQKKTIQIIVKIEKTGKHPKGSFIETVNGISFYMIPVGGGTFYKGPQGNDTIPYNKDELKSITGYRTVGDYYIGETEVTVGLWKALMGATEVPLYIPKSDNYPICEIRWAQIMAFITKLNSLTGKQYRMLTEAEWEYAAHGGDKAEGYTYFAGSNILNEVGWYKYNSSYGVSSTTHQVKQKKANELGLYDMTGNVSELTSDSMYRYLKYTSHGVLVIDTVLNHYKKGGDFTSSESNCRCYRRWPFPVSATDNCVGFRLALTKSGK